MFTVTIESEGGAVKSIREWPTVTIFNCDSSQFADIMKQELARLTSMFENCEEPPESPKAEAEFLTKQYKAVIQSNCGEFQYFAAMDDAIYISNSSGKTVAVIK